MNVNSINKLKLFSLCLITKFDENTTIFNSINITFALGLKKFEGKGTFKDNKISYYFNEITRLLTIKELVDIVSDDALKYDTVSIIYSQRGANVLIIADNKNVKMTNQKSMGFNNMQKPSISAKRVINAIPTCLSNSYSGTTFSWNKG